MDKVSDPANSSPAPIAGTLALTGQPSGDKTEVVPANQVFPDLEPGQLVGEYRVEGKLGQGGMGAVYSAVHPVIGKKVAIKVLNPVVCTDHSVVERFIQEARAVNQICHPNIVDVFAFGQLADGRHYFVMEWLQGETLADRLKRGRLAWKEVTEILGEVVDALEAAHEAQVVHRDLKPANIFLAGLRGSRRVVKVLDFGVAKLLNAPPGSVDTTPETRTGVILGTPGYMAPEQARGKAVGPPTDVYALGAIAYEVAAGKPPFQRDSVLDLLMAHANDPAPPPSAFRPDISPALERVVLQALSKDPASRPTLAVIRHMLAQLDRDPGADPADDSREDPLRADAAKPSDTVLVTPQHLPIAMAAGGHAVDRRRLIWLGGVVTLLGAGGLVAYAAAGRRADPKPDHEAARVSEPTVVRAPQRSEAVDADDAAPASSAAARPSPDSRPTPARAAKSRVAATAAAKVGFVTVNARPWVAVSIDGKLVATETPLRRHQLPIGRHQLRLVNSQTGFQAVRTVKIELDRVREIFVDVPSGSVEIR